MRKYNPLYDIGFWMLLLTNVFIIYSYIKSPNSFYTIIAIYWLQSVLIGVFNFLEIITSNSNATKDFFDNTSNKQMSTGCSSFFFLVHYGFFHVGYLIFLVAKVLPMQSLDYNFIKISFWLLLAASTIHFIQQKLNNNQQKTNHTVLFFLPYLRIIPMHLFIIIPSVVRVANPIIFLILKFIADMLMYIIHLKYKYVNTNKQEQFPNNS